MASVGAEERHLTFSGIQRKLPLLRPRLESIQSFLYSGSGRASVRTGRPNSKIVRIKRKTDVGRENRRNVVDEEVEENRTEH